MIEKIPLELSARKNEPGWMKEFRLNSLNIFLKKSLPKWGPDLAEINFDALSYYIEPKRDQVESVPPPARESLAGYKAQYESEIIYSTLLESLNDEGVIFLSTDEAVQKYPDLLRQYFGTLIPANDNKFAALNSAMWSGGSFLYVPKGVEIKKPLQNYFSIQSAAFGQFERTLIIADEGSSVDFIEGCTAPHFSKNSLHAGVVEIFVKRGARVSYTTMQNWSKNIYNLVTKRAHIEEEGSMRWLDGNFGSKITMKYPSCILAGRKSRGEYSSLAVTSENQNHDMGSKMIHLASETSSLINSRSVVSGNGQVTFRGLIKVPSNIKNVKSFSSCSTLLLGDSSKSNAYPRIDVYGNASASHEGFISKLNEDQLFYLRSRGLSSESAANLIIAGYLNPVINQFPLEYALEVSRMIEKGSNDN